MHGCLLQAHEQRTSAYMLCQRFLIYVLCHTVHVPSLLTTLANRLLKCSDSVLWCFLGVSTVCQSQLENHLWVRGSESYVLGVNSVCMQIWTSSKTEPRYMQPHQPQTPELSSAHLPWHCTVLQLQVLVHTQPASLLHSGNWFSVHSFTGLKKAILSRPLCFHITVSSGVFPRLIKKQTKQNKKYLLVKIVCYTTICADEGEIKK